MELKLKIYITDSNGNKFLGIGVFWLLDQIRRHGSIRAAAAEMGISYSKAYRMLCTLEKALGKPVAERKKGGASRDGAELTPFGELLLQRYAKLNHEIKALAQKPFEVFAAGLQEEVDE